MLTQSAVKTSLAWSTVAQMGFMVMQCGLALFPLALLNIVAHSLYKAHSFLASGGAVERVAAARRPGPVAIPNMRAVVRAFLVALAIYGANGWAFGFQHKSPQAIALGAILIFGVAYLLAQALPMPRRARSRGGWQDMPLLRPSDISRSTRSLSRSRAEHCPRHLPRGRSNGHSWSSPSRVSGSLRWRSRCSRCGPIIPLLPACASISPTVFMPMPCSTACSAAGPCGAPHEHHGGNAHDHAKPRAAHRLEQHCGRDRRSDPRDPAGLAAGFECGSQSLSRPDRARSRPDGSPARTRGWCVGHEAARLVPGSYRVGFGHRGRPRSGARRRRPVFAASDAGPVAGIAVTLEAPR